jgi:hypothetical protein
MSLGVSPSRGATAGGSISGTVRDPSGAVIPGAVVTATNTDTGIKQVVTTNDTGAYSFPVLPVGHYDVDVSAGGFEPYRRTKIALDVSSALLVDVTLALGSSVETVTVSEAALHAETTNTQLGDVISDRKVAALPLNGRSYTDLLALQPGVAPVSTITSQTVQGLGQAVFPPSGDLNAGTISINGQRESANGYLVNGSDAEETGSMAAAIIPNLDSIVEFRILSDNFDAEYGKYTGGQINVITKSGTKEFHGNAFDFVRNTDLDSRNFFSPTRAEYIQNQFGGTAGGPVVRNRIFFFADYQGTRQIQGIDSGQVPVPSPQDLTGNLADQASLLTGTVGGPSFAEMLTNQLEYPVSAGEPYYFSGCTLSSQCVLPNATLPQSAWSAPAVALIKYIPGCTVCTSAGDDTFSTSADVQRLRDDKFGERVDANTGWGTLFGYYAFDDYSLNSPYPVAQGGANVPGFNGLSTGRSQLVDIGFTKMIGTTAISEFHASYTRDANDLGEPSGGLGVSLASQGITGIVPGATEGVENVGFNGGSLVFGTVPGRFNQINNDFGLSENFSKVVGTHSIKFGIQLEYDQIDTHPLSFLNGSFLFNGTETGSAFADFLLGISSVYTQNQLRPFYGRNKYIAPYVQDSWRVKRHLTLNYGLRWDRIEPWYEKYNNNITFIPGEQSVVFPTAPVGIVYPGDPGVSRTLAPPGNKDFSPRIGLAYSPSVRSDSPWARILGGEGKTSIRAGFGILYAAISGETLGLIADNPPYGYTFQNASNPLFVNPFIEGDTGNNEGQRFPGQFAPLTSSPKHPDPNIDFSQFEPIGATPGYKTTNVIPYTEEYMLSVQREIGTSTLVSLNYVGNEGHHLPVLESANPGDPALCLSLPGCGPGGENNVYTSISGQTVNGTRGPLGPAFGSVSYQATIGNSNYNALQASVQHTSRRAQLFFSYTYSKSIDLGSNLGDEVDPFDPKLLRGLSAFDMRHNFVASYTYRLPFEQLFRSDNRLTAGWSVSGITRFSTGFPVTLQNFADTSLIGTFGNGINNLTVDELDFTPGSLALNHNPRNGNSYFNTSLFSLPADDPALGATIANTIGNSGRRFFSGPGINNFDLTLEKDTRITESKSFQFRVEMFNAFNHAQFYGPQAVDGNIGDTTFGEVISAAPPRLIQLVGKFQF